MSTTARTTIITKCDRPKCGTVISETESEEYEDEQESPPALVIKRPGKPDIVYHDLCDRCTNAIDNRCDAIEKRPAKKKAEPSLVPDLPQWDSDDEVWTLGGEAYSHKKDVEATRIPALEGVADQAEAGALIAAYEEAPPTGGEGSDR